MLFNSASFLVFFPMVLALYFAMPHRLRWSLLLAGSYYFYMCWKPEYVVLIVISTLIDYFAAIQMGKRAGKRARRPFLLVSVLANLGLLFSFKYFNFFNDSARVVFEQLNLFYDVPAFDLLLPVGISFYTFQTLSYSIDVYRGQQQPERHLGIFALYVSFFPQLVAGPIERCTRLLPQFYRRHVYDYDRVVDGAKLVLWGLFKKVVIADRLAVYVDAVYSAPGEYHGLTVLMATYFFAFQIYCDFSGYSDMAIGVARIMGFELMENFRRPYFSKSIAEFWRRWHISLSTWFRDYVYIPLGGNRVVKWRWYYNLMVVFVVSGLWHGANWTFIVWGGLHGFYLVFSLITADVRSSMVNRFWREPLPALQAAGIRLSPRLYEWMQVVLTFHLVILAWVFFRANNISDAFVLLKEMFIWNADSAILTVPGFGATEMAISLLVIAVLLSVHVIERRQNFRTYLSTKPMWIRTCAYFGGIALIAFLGKFDAKQFIYFQF